ncbi:MAG: glycosyltransferase, partial [Acidimicrobiales bacterium]|nr:glycosyltransferase [Acidimicrobiales bacterium]
MSPPPKVLHVTTVDMSLELLIGPQLRAFAAAGYEVVGASAPGPYVAGLEADGIRHIPLHHATRAMAPIRDARFVAELYRVLRRERPDIVHLHNPKPGWFGRPTAKVARVPAIVNTVHGLYATPDDPLPMRTVVYGLERFGACFSDVELVQSPEDVEVLRRLRVPASHLVGLGNGIDLDRFSRDAVDADTVARVRAEL